MIARAVVFLGLTIGFLAPCQAQMGKVDTKHVADKSFCVVRIDVKRLVGQLKEKKDAFEQINGMIKSEGDLDLKKLECLTLQFGDSDVDEGSPSFAMTFQFIDHFDTEAFLKKTFGLADFENATINGKSYLKPNSRDEPHIYIESKKKFTMATPGAIEAILNSGGGMGQLSSQLKSAPPGAEIIVAFQKTDGFEDAMKEIMREFRFLPIPSLKLDDFFAAAKSGFGVLNLKSSNPLKVQIEFESSEVTGNAKTGLDGLVALGKGAIDPARKMLKQMLEDLKDDEVVQPIESDAMKAGIKGLNLAEKILAGIRVSSNKKMLDIDVRVMGGATEVADLMAAGLQMTFMGVSRDAERALDGPIPEGKIDRPRKSIKKEEK